MIGRSLSQLIGIKQEKTVVKKLTELLLTTAIFIYF